MSVSQVCEQGFKCQFEDAYALIVDKSGRVVWRFEKEGQLYVATMKLKAPERFHRQS